MKTLLALALCFASFGLINAQEISITTPILCQITEQTTHNIDAETKKPVDIKWQVYHFLVYLTNQANQPLKVVTSQLETRGPTSLRSRKMTLTNYSPTYLEKSQVIPAAEELRLIDIRPGESAAMEFVVKTNGVPLESLVVTYAPKDNYDGRFGFWTGSVTSSPWTIPNPKSQK